MKNVKYLLYALLFTIGFIFISEIYQNYLLSFQNQLDYINIDIEENTSKEKLIKDIKELSAKYEADVVVINQEFKSAYDNKVIIYSTSDNVKTTFEKLYGIEQNDIKSIFAGNTYVEYEDFSKVNRILDKKYIYLVGEENAKKAFVDEFSTSYEVSQLLNGYDGKNERVVISLMWIVISLIILIYSAYIVFFQRKEILVRVIYGDSLRRIIISNVIKDSVILIGESIGIYYVLSRLIYINYYVEIAVTSMVITICINGLLYVVWGKTDVKKIMSKIKTDRSLLVFNYGLKIFTTIFVVLFISGNIMTISNAIQLYSQKSFFKERSDYYYVNTQINDIKSMLNMDNTNYWYDIYVTMAEKTDALVQENICEFAEETYPGVQLIYVNKNNLDYILECIPELDESYFNEQKMYYICPAEIYSNSNIENVIRKETHPYALWCLGSGTRTDYEYEICQYKKNAKIIAVGTQSVIEMRSAVIKNPVILYNNMDEGIKENSMRPVRPSKYCKNAMIKYDENLVKAVQEKWKFDGERDVFYVNNVYEEYEGHLNKAIRLMNMSIVLCMIVFAINLFVLLLIIKLEYSINQIELVIKKVTGYKIYEQFKMLYVSIIGLEIIGALVAVLLNNNLKITNNVYIIIGVAIQMLFELIVINVYSKIKEKENIQKVLKGG